MAETGLNYDLLRLTPPAPTIRSQSAKDFLEGSQAIRDARRKKAIEEAMRKGVDPTGEWNELALRKSLADAGFGEDAESVVRSITSPRADDVSKITALGMQLKELVDAGVVSREKAEELMGNTAQITRTPYQVADQSWSAGVAQSQAAPQTEYASTGTEDGTVRITTTPEVLDPLYEQSSKTSKAQAVPQFAANLIDFSKKVDETTLGDVSASPSGSITYTLPKGDDGKYILTHAATLGYTATDSVSLDAQLDARAKALVPQPVFAQKGPDMKSWYEAQAEYKKAVAEYPAKFTQQKAVLIKELEAGQAARFGQKATKIAQDVTKAQEARAGRKERTEILPYLASENPGILRKDVTKPDYDFIQTARPNLNEMQLSLDNYKNAPNFPNLSRFIVATLKANGQPVTHDTVENEILSTGAIPKAKELIFKKALRDLSVGDLVAGNIAQMLSDLDITEQAAPISLLEDRIKDIKQTIYDRGGKVQGYPPAASSGTGGQTKPPVAAPQTPPAKPSRRKASAEDF